MAIIYRETNCIHNLPFEDYLKLPGYSFSWLKHEENGMPQEVNPTFKIRVGKIVDAILTQDGSVDMNCEEYPIAKSIAIKIKDKFGPMLHRFQKQLSFTGTVYYSGLKMAVRGRTDYVLPKTAVIDLKVTFEKAYKQLISYMQYDDQQWNYCNLAGVTQKYIMIHSVPLGITDLIRLEDVKPENKFWETKIQKFGYATTI